MGGGGGAGGGERRQGGGGGLGKVKAGSLSSRVFDVCGCGSNEVFREVASLYHCSFIVEMERKGCTLELCK